MPTPRYAFVYSGDGASQRSALSAIESLKATLNARIQVRQLCAIDLLEGGWQEHTALLVFPGGADLPYCHFLNGAGNKMIADYVRAGGAYLGLCAGAYYACSRIEFEKDTPLQVAGPRELGFFPGLGKGAVQPGFDYSTEAGTAAMVIRFKEHVHETEWCECRDYSNGGPCFILDDKDAPGIHVLAEYAHNLDPVIAKYGNLAAVQCEVGEGVAVLCGTHPELSPWWLDAICDPRYIQRCHPHLGEDQIDKLVKNSVGIKIALSEDQAKREKFWKSLLRAAGLERSLQENAPSECIHPIAKGPIPLHKRSVYREITLAEPLISGH